MRNKPGELSNCNTGPVLPSRGILNLPAPISVLGQYGYNGYYSIEMFNEELWQLPAIEVARRCYASLLPFCQTERKYV